MRHLIFGFGKCDTNIFVMQNRFETGSIIVINHAFGVNFQNPTLAKPPESASRTLAQSTPLACAKRKDSETAEMVAPMMI